MNMSIKRIDNKYVYLIIEDSSTTITQNITDIGCIVNTDFIETLEDIAKELRLHNEEIIKKTH